MTKGRPLKSEIRKNIVEILNIKKSLYGYEIYKIYTAIFPKVTLRSIYYNLSKGVQTGELKVEKVIKMQKQAKELISQKWKRYTTLLEKTQSQRALPSKARRR